MASEAAPDVVIVGGGITGTAAAAFLAGAGASVVLIEREGLASGASGANSGVVQHPFDPVLAALYLETLALYRELAATSNAFRIGQRPAGMLYVSTLEAAARHQSRLIDAAFPALRTEVIGGEELRRVEPAAGEDLWACRLDIGFPVLPGASTYAYATLAEERGAVLRLGRAATIEVRDGTATGVVVDGRRLAAGAVMAAAGPWTPALIDPTGTWAPILPRWGVVVDAELADPPRHVLEEAGIEAVLDVMPGEPPVGAASVAGSGATSGAASVAGSGAGTGAGSGASSADAPAIDPDGIEFSLVPLPSVASVGSTFLPREPDPPAWMERILVRAARFVPGVADAPIRSVHACARPQSVDGRPLIGLVAGRRNLYVCSGHGPWGISTGPGSARLVADLILGRRPRIAPELDPARFGPPPG